MPVVTAEPGPLRSGGPGDADPDDPYPYGPGSARIPRGRPWDGVAWAAIGVLAAAALVIGVVVAETPKPVTTLDTGTAATVAFVTQSAQSTLAQRTADLTLSGEVQVSGKSIPLTGTGQVDFTTNAMTLDTGFSVAGHSMQELEVLVNGSLYIELGINGTGAAFPGGRTWIQMPLEQSSSANLTDSDPLSALTVLEQQGDTVQGLGTKLVGGVTCSGFAVTPSTQAMLAGVRKEAAALGFSPAMTSAELNLVRNMTPPTVTIWVDPQHLVREMSVGMQLFGGAVSENAVMDFSHFGVPTQITAPAPSSVISYASAMQAIPSQF
jgi:hypothetical protein